MTKVEDGSAVVWALLDGASDETNEEAATEDLAEEEAASEEAAGEEEGVSEVAAGEEDGASEEEGSADEADEEAAEDEDDEESLELESAPETSWPCSLHEASNAFLAVSASPSGHWLSKHFSTSSPMEVQIHSKSAKLLHLEFFST